VSDIHFLAVLKNKRYRGSDRVHLNDLTFDVNKLTVDDVEVIFIVAGVIARFQITGVLNNQDRTRPLEFCFLDHRNLRGISCYYNIPNIRP
jgi:hypothetical protein